MHEREGVPRRNRSSLQKHFVAEMATANKPHAALLASPGMGHLIPVVELGKRLATHRGFHVTIFVVTAKQLQYSSLLQQPSNGVTAPNVVVLPPIDVDSTKLGPNPSLLHRIEQTMLESLPSLRSSILSMKNPPTLLIVDLFGMQAFPMARDLGMSTYLFVTTNAWFSAVTIYLPSMDPKQVEDTRVGNGEPLFVPGCEPVRFEDAVDMFFTREGCINECFVETAKQVVAADGILMNTWRDLEPAATKAITESGILGRFPRGPVYPVGPLVRTLELMEQNTVSGNEAVMKWLDRQPDESVIYVSFGSGGTMSEAQTRELALGLELSEQRFVWVVRPPVEGDACSAYLDSGNGGEEMPEYLPEGFRERTRELGVVVSMWGPQAEILGHRATGGFVTHCGWNSVLEGIFGGVAMVAWPLYAEQKMNATMLSDQLGVAARVKAEEGGGVVGREEIAGLVRRIMVDEEGGVMRAKVKELKLSGEKALCEFGSSYESLCEMAKDIVVRLQGSEANARGA